MKLSRRPSPLRVPLNAVSLPASSRSTVKTGCTSRRMSRPRSLTSPRTESTRNGISSLRISSTAKLRGRARRRKSDFGRVRLALEQKRPRSLADGGKFLRVVAFEVVEHGPPEQFGQKIRRNVAPASGQKRCRRTDKRLSWGDRPRGGECSARPCLPVFALVATIPYDTTRGKRASATVTIYNVDVSAVAAATGQAPPRSAGKDFNGQA